MQDLLFGIDSYIHFLQYAFSDIDQHSKLWKKAGEILLLVIMKTAIFLPQKNYAEFSNSCILILSYIHIIF